jgi:methoxymalonate biosynthesis acyl carrier protein
MEESRAKLRKFLGRRNGGRIPRDDEQIFASGFVNSLFAMQLVLFVEREFQITVGPEDLRTENFQTIEAIAQLVDRKLNSSQEEVDPTLPHGTL